MRRCCAALLPAILLCACTELPSLDGRTASRALLAADTRDTLLGRALAPAAERHPGLSGIAALTDPLDAFAARMQLVAAAQRTIDVQYYIWRDDITGNQLLQALRLAAGRQVRVRMLLDDNGIAGLDQKLAALNALPNVEVRLFNPAANRRFKWLGLFTDASRLNRRMHNKSLTVDGQLTVVGGRNIGDEYFGATLGVEFVDLDVLVAGAVVDDVSRDFDRYWNSASAYPLETLAAAPARGDAAPWPHGTPDANTARQAQAYAAAVAQSHLVQDLRTGKHPLDWVPVRMVSDDPAKVLGKAPPEAMLWSRLKQMLGAPTVSLDVISPYFVPTSQGVDAFGALATQGVKTRILTNALESTDVAVVHAGYARYRAALLQRGVTLFEMRRLGHQPPKKEKAGRFASSGASLHAKVFAVDRKRVFVGSFNFDPRSARLNTELGFVIDSEKMAAAIAHAFDDEVTRHAYRLELDKGLHIVWLRQDENGVTRLTTEPNTSIWQRLYVRLLSLLPIESIL